MNNEFTLSVNRNIKRIKVNEAGEFISLDFDDQGMIPRLLDLMEEFEKEADIHAERLADIGEMPEETQDERNAKIVAAATLNLEVCSKMKTAVDDAFGDQVCRKVFGDIIPSVEAFAEFFAQLGAIVARFKVETIRDHDKKIEKYTEKYREKGR